MIPREAAPAVRARRAYWPLTFALLVLVAVGCGALSPLLRGTGWWWAMAFAAGVVLLAAAGFRHLGMSRSIVPVAALAVLLLLLTLLFGAGTGLVWLVPTPETFVVFQGLIDAGVDSIRQQATPAEAVPGIVFLLSCGAGLIAVLMDILAVTLRWPALAGIPILIPAGVPGLIIDGGAEVFTLVLVAGAFLLLLRVDSRTRRAEEENEPDGGRDAARVVAHAPRPGPGPMWGAMTVGGVGIISALVLSSATPALTQSSLVGSGAGGLLFGSGVSPMVDLGQDLRRPQAGPALHYTTTAVTPPYFTLLTLDQFVGTTWISSGTRLDRDNTVEEIERPPGLSRTVESVETRTSIVVDGVDTSWLPAPTPAIGVEGLGGSWFWDSRTRAITSFNATTLGQDYVVTALDLQPTAAQLRDSSTGYPQSVAAYVELPDPRPEIIDQTAREITAGSITPYDRAVALQDYLNGGEFAYDTEAPVDDGYDGGGADVIGTFLEVQRGYCVHFASAMAVMARSLGIPARVALGYLPGTKIADTAQGPGRYNVDSHDLHSWPELYFVGVGWVPFEPTPGRGTVPAYARPAESSGTEPSGGATLPTSAPRAGEEGLTPGGGTVNSATNSANQSENLVRAGSALVLVLCLLAAPGVIRQLRRHGRLRRIRRGLGSASAAWTELADTALDHGVRVSERETPRELADRLSTLPGLQEDEEEAAALDRLLVAVEQHHYARPGRAVTAEQGAALAYDLDLIIAAVGRGAGRAGRIRSAVLPASLWPAVLARQNRAMAATA